MRVKIYHNQSILQIINNTDKTIHYTPKLSMGIVDIRFLGYYNVTKGVMFFDKRGNNQIPPPPYKLPNLHPQNYYKASQNREVETKRSDPDPYPWLDLNDPRRNMTNEEILDKYIDLSNSDLKPEESNTLMNIIKSHKEAFSLRDEIGKCPNIKIDIDVDDSPFFVRPFPIHKEDKALMDKYMAKLVSLEILSKNNTTHTSPVMLVARKGTKDKRPVVDFRLLNTRIMRRKTATPLLRAIFKILILGNSKCEVLSCLDLKDAFHKFGLTDKAKEFCGILPYFGSAHYRYEVLPIGLSISPQVWITYIENLLEGIPNRQSYIAIMDDLMLHELKSDHVVLFEQLLIALISCGLKLSPRKCQLFMKHLVYLGNVFHIENGVNTITPMKSKIEAIQKLPPPTTVKECKSFCGNIHN